MLGENHALILEFPEYKQKIQQLGENDPHFSELATEYQALDLEIRGLEENCVPTAEERFNQLTLRRAELKSWLYQQLLR
ncbi:YdcH family protein [Shewanella algae]